MIKMVLNKHIKKGLVYLFLSIYSFAVLKPIIPVAKDFIAHAFNAQSHLATVHYEKGKYHLHVEVAKAAKETTSNQTINTAFYETFQNHTAADVLKYHLFPVCSQLNFHYPNYNEEDMIQAIQTPPPKV
jgi:uncharacterized membrane protein